MELTKSEMQIMDVLWASDVPLSRSDLLERSDGKTWKDSSIHILLNGLLAKGAIQEAGFVKCSKTYGRTFVPAMTREKYYACLVFSRACKPEPVGLIKELLEVRAFSREELVRVGNLIEEKLKTM